MILACDPGMSGGFCLMELNQKTLHHSSVRFFPFPAIAKEPDLAGLVRIFQQLPQDVEVHGIIEKVSAMPGQGVSSMFKFGRSYGIAQAFYASSGVSISEVTPRKWQKELFEGLPEIKKSNGKRDTKKMSLLAASRLFPDVECKKDWQSDSLLLAEYYRRNIVGNLIQNIKTPANNSLSAGA